MRPAKSHNPRCPVALLCQLRLGEYWNLKQCHVRRSTLTPMEIQGRLYLLPCCGSATSPPKPRSRMPCPPKCEGRVRPAGPGGDIERRAGDLACRHIKIGAGPLGCYAPRVFSIHPELVLIYFFTERCLCDDYPLGFKLTARSLSSRTDECGVAIHVKSANAIANKVL